MRVEPMYLFFSKTDEPPTYPDFRRYPTVHEEGWLLKFHGGSIIAVQ